MSEEMTYAHLGRSGLMVSRIGLGTMNFGYTMDEPSSFAVMDAAIDAGINFFDTADVYGGPQSPDMKKGYGIAEETVGRWLRRSGRRDDIVLATKVYQPMGLGPNDRRLSAYHIRRACEASLRRLQIDHIDLYQMHHVDRATSWEEIWQAMEQLVRQGKISYVGSSNFAAWDVALAHCAASARHFMGLTSEQSLYNLAVRTVELELIPALRSLGIGLIPYSPLHAGLLAGVLEAATEGGISDDSTHNRIEAHRDQLEAYEGCAGSLARSRWRWRWPGCCATLSSPPRSSKRRRSRSCSPTSARCRCSWTPRSWNDSTGFGRGRGKRRRRTPGKADPATGHRPLLA
jgi:aryl-alcohol dehydrogenase-like predicted oxidoreductase